MISKNKTKPHSWLDRLKKQLQREPENLEQLLTMLANAKNRSIINSETMDMIESVVLFSQMQVRDIMFPKQQMTCISDHTSLNDVIDIVTQSGHSRFPVIDNKQDVIGILHAKDLLRFQSSMAISYDLLDIIRQATFVPESKRLDLLLSEFRSNRNHMAIVVDEYGSVSGFVTLEDIIEQIIGEIEDEFDIDEDAYIKAHSNAQYIIKAQTPIDEFNEQLHAQFSEETYDTIGGIVMSHFGYLPKRGEIIMIEQFEFKVISADARRIKLLECKLVNHEKNTGSVS